MFIFCNYITVYLLLCSTVGKYRRWQNLTLKMMFVALRSAAACIFYPRQVLLKRQRISVEVGRESESHSSPAACVPSFQAECCCLLALQERVQKNNTVEVCILRMCIIFQRRMSYTQKRGKKKSF